MLLTTKEKPFNSKEHYFEFKWDGFRCIIFITKNKVYLQSRNQNNLTEYFPELKNLPSHFKTNNIILDGEICYFTENGKQNFHFLQSKLKNKKTKKFTTYIAWDILDCDNYKNIFNLPLSQRRKYLKKSIKKESILFQLSPIFKNCGKKLYKTAREEKMEGIVAKKIDSPYIFKRSSFWKKIKIWQYKKILIGGYTKKKSLLVGKNFKGKLHYRGKVKINLNKIEKTALFNYLPELQISTSPFLNIQKKQNNTIWIKPVIKAEVKYTGLTPDKKFRHGYLESLII